MENTTTLSVERYNVAPLIRIDCISLSDIVDYYMGKRLRNGLFFFVSEDRIRHICMPYK